MIQRRLRIAAVASLLALIAPPSHGLASEPAGSLRQTVRADNTVLVLGTPHLTQLPATFRPEHADPLVARLVGWAPDAIAVEESAGLLCDSMRRLAARHADAIAAYCFDPAPAAAATGLDVPAATLRAEALLAALGPAPAPGQRRALAAAFLAAGEPGSALVQWLRLPEGERRADGALTGALVDILRARAASRNETGVLAARIAAGAGLERLWSVDHQAGDMGPLADEQAYGRAIMAAWDNPATRARAARDEALEAGLGSPDGLLAIYRAYNASDHPARVEASDFGAALREPSPEGHGRRYVAYWETRNLRMVANIREVLGRKPGTRLLAIVGASHKGDYESLLGRMRDVALADAMPLLAPTTEAGASGHAVPR